MSFPGSDGVSATPAAAVPGPAPVAAPTATAKAATPAKPLYTVTLITGAVHPGPVRERMSFALSSARGHFMVIPADGATLIRTRQVDQRLFDVTELNSLG